MKVRMNRIGLPALLICSNMALYAQQWNESNYNRYTYQDYTQYEPFREVINPAAFDARLLNAAVFYETNRQRVLHGGKTYQYEYNLEVCAQNHTYDMITCNFYSHESVVPGKKTVPDRFQQLGIEYRSYAENIQYCPIESDWTYEDCAKALVNNWMNSPVHRRNILNANYSYLGCGTGLYSRGGFIYIKSTQNFLQK